MQSWHAICLQIVFSHRLNVMLVCVSCFLCISVWYVPWPACRTHENAMVLCMVGCLELRPRRNFLALDVLPTLEYGSSITFLDARTVRTICVTTCNGILYRVLFAQLWSLITDGLRSMVYTRLVFLTRTLFIFMLSKLCSNDIIPFVMTMRLFLMVAWLKTTFLKFIARLHSFLDNLMQVSCSDSRI